MRKYCKAYRLHDFRQFPAWQENVLQEDDVLTDDTICYLWDDLTVVRSPIRQNEVLFASDTLDWKDFCAQKLAFSVPEDLASSDLSHPATTTA